MTILHLLILSASGFTAEGEETQENIPIASNTEDPSENLKAKLIDVEQKVSNHFFFK